MLDPLNALIEPLKEPNPILFIQAPMVLFGVDGPFLGLWFWGLGLKGYGDD